MEQGERGLAPVLPCSRGFYTCITAVFFLISQPLLSFGADENSLPWKITADRITHQQEPEQIIAEGTVVLEQYKENAPTGVEIKADRIQYSIDSNSVDAAGNLFLQDNHNLVQASDAQVDLEKQIGYFKEATIFWPESNFSASADLIEKTDIQSYHFINGKLTPCPAEKGKAPDW
ncbi:MAG: LPS-assembly protein LptD, partial [Deltaproteobacteria bacterium]|nr:LPS-assembly protein LptD [Deltaproteobacteria bacterium]